MFAALSNVKANAEKAATAIVAKDVMKRAPDLYFSPERFEGYYKSENEDDLIGHSIEQFLKHYPEEAKKME